MGQQLTDQSKVDAWLIEFREYLGQYQGRAIAGFKLCLSNNGLTDKAFESIVDVLDEREIDFMIIQVHHNKLGSRGFRRMISSFVTPRLEELHASHNALKDPEVSAIRFSDRLLSLEVQCVMA